MRKTFKLTENELDIYTRKEMLLLQANELDKALFTSLDNRFPGVDTAQIAQETHTFDDHVFSADTTKFFKAVKEEWYSKHPEDKATRINSVIFYRDDGFSITSDVNNVKAKLKEHRIYYKSFNTSNVFDSSKRADIIIIDVGFIGEINRHYDNINPVFRKFIADNPNQLIIMTSIGNISDCSKAFLNEMYFSKSFNVVYTMKEAKEYLQIVD